MAHAFSRWIEATQSQNWRILPHCCVGFFVKLLSGKAAYSAVDVKNYVIGADVAVCLQHIFHLRYLPAVDIRTEKYREEWNGLEGM
jgi:hypothetical protein